MNRFNKCLRGRTSKFGKQRDMELKEASRIMFSSSGNRGVGGELSGEENNFNFKDVELKVTIRYLVSCQSSSQKEG